MSGEWLRGDPSAGTAVERLTERQDIGDQGAFAALFDEATGCLDLGTHTAVRKMPHVLVREYFRQAYLFKRLLLRSAEIDCDPLDGSQNHHGFYAKHVCHQCGGQVFVYDGFDATAATVFIAYYRYAATTAGDDYRAAFSDRIDERDVAELFKQLNFDVMQLKDKTREVRSKMRSRISLFVCKSSGLVLS